MSDKTKRKPKPEWLKRLERALDWEPPEWGWPALMFVLGAGAFTASWMFSPVSDTVVAFLGEPLHGTCSFLDQTGIPCPSCGMTRSWIHSARGHIWTGMVFNPAGALLFWWLMVGWFLGSIRLITRNYTLLKVPNLALAGWAIFWMIVPYTAFWLMRVGFGVNPLPEIGM